MTGAAHRVLRFARHVGLAVLSAACDSTTEAERENVIGPRGGRVEAAGGRVILVFPPDAVTTSLAVSVSAVTQFPEDPGLVPETAYDLRPDGVRFQQPVQLTIAYDRGRVPSGVNESSLRLSRRSVASWQDLLESSLDTARQQVTGFISGFSVYGIRGELVGDLLVVTSTTGPDLDPDGYRLVVDGGLRASVGVNDTTVFEGLAEGDHTVELTEVAGNCTVSGENLRTVTVPFDDTVETSFAVSCVTRTGDLRVNVSTTGEDLDPDGYRVVVDGGVSDSVGVNDTTVFRSLAEGDHTFALTGVAGNCTVSGENPRTVAVPFNATVETTFAVSCVTRTGDLRVNVSTTGEDLDPDGYRVVVDGGVSDSVGVNDTTVFRSLAEGDHTVALIGVAGNCTVSGENPRTVTVPFNATAETGFAVSCVVRTGDLRVIVSTTGKDLDPDGYRVVVDGGVSDSVGVNDTTVFVDLTEGDHTVALTGVADNCTVSGENPRTVTVPFNATAETGFAVSCVVRTGDLRVIVSTTGKDLDPDGYRVVVDGGVSDSVGVNDTTVFERLTEGDHTVELTGVAGNCMVTGENPRTVKVPFNSTAETTFEVSCAPREITGVTWDCANLITDAVGSDLWPITWSDDGHQYTAWGDGDGFQVDAKHGYGIARIEGQPIGYVATDLFQAPGGAEGKVSGMISLGGVLYMWRFDQLAAPNEKQHTLIRSTDKGASVAAMPVQFPRVGAPNMVANTFVNQGRDNADAIDGYVYSTAADWVTADPVYLLRVPVDRIEEPAAYEVFSGTAASPAWSTDFTQRRPVYSDPIAATFNGAAHTVITYFAPRQRFILTAHHADDMGKWSIHQGPKPWGPWTEIARYSDWCGFGEGLAEVLPRYMAPKWISADGTEFWMVFSGTQMWDRFNTIRGIFQLQ